MKVLQVDGVSCLMIFKAARMRCVEPEKGPASARLMAPVFVLERLLEAGKLLLFTQGLGGRLPR